MEIKRGPHRVSFENVFFKYEEQVSKIANYLASINTSIPYSLLAFYPAFAIDDLPTTSKKHAERCFKIAKKQGLENISIGNKHLLR